MFFYVFSLSLLAYASLSALPTITSTPWLSSTSLPPLNLHCHLHHSLLFLPPSLGHKCPSTFNPADYYIHTLAVFPGHESRSRERIKRICDNFAVSAYCKDIDITIQYQDNMRMSNTECGSSVRAV